MIYGSAASAAAQAGNNYAAQSSDGLVEHLADRIGASGILEAFNRSTGGKVVNWILDKAGEGMEETITGFGEPLIDRITYDPKADLATVDELADEFLGGVVLSLLLSGGELMSSGKRSGNGISGREVIDRLEEMGIPSEIAREYAAQTAQAASVLINAEKPVPPVPQRAAERPTEAPLTPSEDRGTMKPKAYEFGNNDFYGIETPQVVRTISRRNAEYIDGGQLYVDNNGRYLVSVNPDGSSRGFAALNTKLPAAAKQVGYGKLKGVGNQKGVTNGRGEGQEVRV